ncbi:MAG: hypothetical protein NC191_04850 [Muribaculaceae bacterium]|nr:hypothetical protein [Muribaculaceae bacterium]
MRVTGITSNLPFQARLDISKIKNDKESWRNVARKFNDSEYDDKVFRLQSMDDGSVKGQYNADLVKSIDFNLSSDGVENLLNKSPSDAAGIFAWIQLGFTLAEISILGHQNLQNIIKDYTILSTAPNFEQDDDMLEELNYQIARSNKNIAKYNELYKKYGLTLDYQPYDNVRAKTDTPEEKELRLKKVNKRIREIRAELSDIEQDIQALKGQSFFVRVFKRSEHKKAVEDKLSRKDDLELRLQGYIDELKSLERLYED